MDKTYRLKNGYSIKKGNFYDGYNMNVRWWIYEPNGNVYISCGSYKEAYEIASNLVNYEDAEDKALKDIDNYVADVCGGWL